MIVSKLYKYSIVTKLTTLLATEIKLDYWVGAKNWHNEEDLRNRGCKILYCDIQGVIKPVLLIAAY
jgi:hypothetical protein